MNNTDEQLGIITVTAKENSGPIIHNRVDYGEQSSPLKESQEEMNLKKGDCFYMVNDRRKYHVVAVLDEEEEQVVYKFYGIYKQWWHYKVESARLMETSFGCGVYTRERKKRERKDES